MGVSYMGVSTLNSPNASDMSSIPGSETCVVIGTVWEWAATSQLELDAWKESDAVLKWRKTLLT